MKTLYFLKIIPHMMNQMNTNLEEIKPKAKIQFRIAGIPESACRGMEIVYFNH